MDYFNVDNQIKELVKLKLYPPRNFETTILKFSGLNTALKLLANVAIIYLVPFSNLILGTYMQHVQLLIQILLIK
jgi:hypothetical protein